MKRLVILLPIAAWIHNTYALEHLELVFRHALVTGKDNEFYKLLYEIQPDDEFEMRLGQIFLGKLTRSSFHSASQGCYCFREKDLPLFTPEVLKQVEINLLSNKKSKETAEIIIEIIRIRKLKREVTNRMVGLSSRKEEPHHDKKRRNPERWLSSMLENVACQDLFVQLSKEREELEKYLKLLKNKIKSYS